MIRAVIIDDEINCRQTLLALLKKYCQNVEVVAEAANISEGLKIISENSPDLVFLDVQMTDGTGFDLLERSVNVKFKTIFVTAHDTYAIRAFKFSATDYLLKPVEADELVAAVNKIDSGNKFDEINLKLEALISNRTNVEKIALPALDGIRLIKINEIIRCESDSNYTSFFLSSKNKIVVTRTLKEYEELLTPHGFFRIHQSHLVNLSHVSRYVKGEGGSVILDDGSEVEVARRRKEELLAVLLQS
jgi:two-component system, LytTR family, response regulator